MQKGFGRVFEIGFNSTAKVNGNKSFVGAYASAVNAE